MKLLTMLLIVSLMCSAVNLKAVEVGDKPPEELDAPGGLFLTQRQQVLLDPYFRNALWYYDAYSVYVKYSKDLEVLNASQGEDIDLLLEEATKADIGFNILLGATVISTVAIFMLAATVKKLL